ncbi:MAG: hypothetical protein LBB76_06855, partial [Azoarcus sp.]|nr:hypothetical protein [Azoarcus sp.]
MRRGKPVAGLLASVLSCLACATPARADDGPDTLWRALENAKVGGSAMFFQRHRERYDVEKNRFGSNLHHRTLQGEIHVSTPYALGNTLGLEAGLFGTADLANGAGAPDHEISFFPWQNPWSADWTKRDARSGFSLYRAHLKAQRVTDTGRWWGKLGYFQPEGPGVLGVNWSL